MKAPTGRKTCTECQKSYANARSLSSHKSQKHRKPVVKESEDPAYVQEKEEVSPAELSEVDSSETEDLKPEMEEEEKPLKNTGNCTRPTPYRTKNSLGKLSYRLDPSFDLMDAFEVKNLFIRLKEDNSKSAKPFTGRYMLFIDAIVELNSLTEVCSLLNSRAVMLKNILKKLEQRSSLWSGRIKSFRLNANC